MGHLNAAEEAFTLTFDSASGMNWTCLVYGGPMLFVIIYWFVDAHKWFKGPKVRLLFNILYNQTDYSPLTCFTSRSTSSTKCSAEKVTWWTARKQTVATQVPVALIRTIENSTTSWPRILLDC